MKKIHFYSILLASAVGKLDGTGAKAQILDEPSGRTERNGHRPMSTACM
ncbi:MAG: hypothetical protein K6B45_05150 [Bacteroidaceae bacterium]|nr:hypothetical protein [Bacteroidaceae bacterium]